MRVGSFIPSVNLGSLQVFSEGCGSPQGLKPGRLNCGFGCSCNPVGPKRRFFPTPGIPPNCGLEEGTLEAEQVPFGRQPRRGSPLFGHPLRPAGFLGPKGKLLLPVPARIVLRDSGKAAPGDAGAWSGAGRRLIWKGERCQGYIFFVKFERDRHDTTYCPPSE